MNRTRATAVIAALAAGALALTACGSSSSSSTPSSAGSSVAAGATSAASAPAAASGAPSSSAAPAASGSAGASAAPAGGGSESITIGSANFSESVLLADIYGEALKAKGVKVTDKPKIGSREVYIPAIKDGSHRPHSRVLGHPARLFRQELDGSQLRGHLQGPARPRSAPT